MTHEYLKISTDNGATWRELKDNETTFQYLTKLSHAAEVLVRFDSGERWTMECGEITQSGLFGTPSDPLSVAINSSDRAEQLVDNLVYANYKFNRDCNPSISADRWAKVYGSQSNELATRYEQEQRNLIVALIPSYLKSQQ